MGREIRVSIEWHDLQWEVFHDAARFKIIFAGRRWGKTRGAIQRLVEKLFHFQAGTRHTGKEKLGWWVSLTARQAKIAYRYFRRIFYKSGIILKENKSELTFDLVLGNRLEFRSAEIPENLRGDAPDHLVLDEAPYMSGDVWFEVLRPALMDSEGTCDFIGTPHGMNWMHELWMLGQSGTDVDWKSWTCSTFDNPYISKKEIQSAISRMPEMVVQQEIYAVPMTDSGMVFRNVDAVSVLQPKSAILGRKYTLGVDLAKYKDWTVISVKDDATNEQVHLERFNKIDWTLQKRRIIETAVRYNNGQVYVDSTGVGDPIYEDLARAGLNVIPYQLNVTTKKELIDNLVLKLDKQEIKLLDDPVQKGELKSYAYELTSAGRLKTNAPEGQHDDHVIALALCHADTIANAHSGLFDFYRSALDEMNTKKRIS